MSYGLIHLSTSWSALDVFLAKILAETILFLQNFAVQRDFVFSRAPQADRPISRLSDPGRS